MDKTVSPDTMLHFFERSLRAYPDREVYGDSETDLTYEMTAKLAKSAACAIYRKTGTTKRPVVVYMEKSAVCAAAIWSVIYSGNYYCPIDVEMPETRVKTILDILKPECVVTDRAQLSQAEQIFNGYEILIWEEITGQEADEAVLDVAGRTLIETDPLYVLFTSGSTGVPKGVLVSHKVIRNYLVWLGSHYDYTCEDVFGNQAPFYFDVSVHDLFGAVYFGAKAEIIPPMLFSFPLRLVQFMNEKKISTFLWVPSAMGIVAKLKTFRAEKPNCLRHAMFAGEVLPRKYLDYWVSNLPDVLYANLYGPTETFVCTAYDYTGEEPEGQPLPIGWAIANCEALVLDENDKEAGCGQEGELCLRGDCLALGYFNNKEKTEQSFIQNPLHDLYPDRIYRTGDLVKRMEDGNLIYISRKDFQIKHMGYRIELGEIENAVSLIEGVSDCACAYDERRTQIVLFYDGKKQEESELVAKLKARIPGYMIPERIIHMPALPHNDNGKTDRKKLKDML